MFESFGSSMNRFPWGSPILLLLAYIMVGYALSKFFYPWGILLFVVGWVALRIIVLVSPKPKLKHWLYCYFGSDTTNLTGLAIVAALVSIVLVWLHISLQILMVVSAEALARIDLRTLSKDRLNSTVFLFFVPMFGLVVGWLASRVYL